MISITKKLMLCLALVLLGLQGSSAGKVLLRHQKANVSPRTAERMQKVIDALADILENADKQEKIEAGNYKCFVEWCGATSVNYDEVLDAAQSELETKTASVKTLTAKIEHLQNELDEADAEIQELTDGLTQAGNIRDEEHDRYSEDMQNNKQSQSQINRAIEIEKGVVHTGGFLQNGVLRRLQLNEPGESSYVLGVMEDLFRSFKKAAVDMDETEHEKEEQYDGLVNTKGSQLHFVKQERDKKASWLQADKTQLVTDKHDATRLAKFVEENTAELDEIKASCTKKKHEWQIRDHDRGQEKAAIREAITYLNTGMRDAEAEEAAALDNPYPLPENETVHVATAGGGDDDDDDDAATSFLQQSSATHTASSVAAVEAQVTALLAGANGKNQKDGFDAAKQVVVELLAVLQQQEKDEKEKKEYCQHGIHDKDKEEEDVKDEIEGLEAMIEKQKAESDQLEQEIEDLKLALKRENETLTDATRIRSQEKETHRTSTEDRALSIKVIKQAKEVLEQFYSSNDPTKNHLMQTKHKVAKKEAPETFSGSSRSGGKDVVLALLDKILDDIRIEQQDADKDEQESQDEYDKLVLETRQSFDERMEAITARVKRKAKIGVARTNNLEEAEQNREELGNIKKEQQSLSDECDDLLKHYDSRVKARQFEMDQLHDVMDILAGSSIAARTGLLQKLPSSQAWAAQEVAVLDGGR